MHTIDCSYDHIWHDHIIVILHDCFFFLCMCMHYLATFCHSAPQNSCIIFVQNSLVTCLEKSIHTHARAHTESNVCSVCSVERYHFRHPCKSGCMYLFSTTFNYWNILHLARAGHVCANCFAIFNVMNMHVFKMTPWQWQQPKEKVDWWPWKLIAFEHTHTHTSITETDHRCYWNICSTTCHAANKVF